MGHTTFPPPWKNTTRRYKPINCINRELNMKYFLFFLFLFSIPAYAYDTFHPEADADLNDGKIWVETVFKEGGDTGTKTSFRIWFPHPPSKVWEVLIDTNNWKKIHQEYTDSGTMSSNQYALADTQNPANVKDFLALVGPINLPSQAGRVKNGTWTSYVYQNFNLPWPLSDRWVVMKVKNDEDNAAKGEYRYEYKMDVGNFKELKGYWELLPVPDHPNWTEYRGEYRADPGISVPHFLAKKLFKASIKRNAEENEKVLNH